jgi:hypothetical protein
VARRDEARGDAERRADENRGCDALQCAHAPSAVSA